MGKKKLAAEEFRVALAGRADDADFHVDTVMLASSSSGLSKRVFTLSFVTLMTPSLRLPSIFSSSVSSCQSGAWAKSTMGWRWSPIM